MNLKFGLAAFVAACTASAAAEAIVYSVELQGSDSIWLAGRTDLLPIPPANQPWPGGMVRHGGPTPEEIQETMPPGFAVTAGDIVRVLDPASGLISFFNGFGGGYGPEGNGAVGDSTISSFGGISGYRGTQGALVGVFLTGDIPASGAPDRIDFAPSGVGINFEMLTPGLGQVFFIGNGVNADNVRQQFIAPIGATRVFIGITDAFGFNGAPGAFDDNDGAYQLRFSINEDPRNPVTGVPAPGAVGLIGLGLLGLGFYRRKAR